MNERNSCPRRDRPVTGQYQGNAVGIQKKNGDDAVKATLSLALKEQNFEGSCQRISPSLLHENLSCACLGRNGESRGPSPCSHRPGLRDQSPEGGVSALRLTVSSATCPGRVLSSPESIRQRVMSHLGTWLTCPLRVVTYWGQSSCWRLQCVIRCR